MTILKAIESHVKAIFFNVTFRTASQPTRYLPRWNNYEPLRNHPGMGTCYSLLTIFKNLHLADTISQQL